MDERAASNTQPSGDSTVRSALRLSSDWVSPINATVFTSTLILDLLAPLFGRATSRLAAVAGAACILLLLITMIRLERRRTEQQPIRSRLDFYARSRKLWLATTCCMGGFALAFATFSHADAPNPSAIGSAVPAIGQLQQSLAALHAKVDVVAQRTSDIQDDTQAIRRAVDPQDDRGRLTRLGYGLDDESKARAIEACDIDATTLYAHLNETIPLALPVFGKRGGSTLEAPILAKNEHFAEMLRILSDDPKFDKAALSTAFPLTFTQAQTRSIPAMDGLLAKARRRGLRTVGLLPSMVKASPLIVAIWSGNADAATALLNAGANADAPAIEVIVPVMDHGNPALKNVSISTAREEAQRMKWTVPGLE
jgi:hypothetical protein